MADAQRVIVCGGGLAGLSAAVTAAEAGARVLLIEKAPALGGTTMLSGGLLWTFDDYDEARRKVPDGDAALQWLVFDTLDDSRRWLSSLGVDVGAPERVLGHGRGTSVDPAEMIDVLAHRLRSLGGEVRTESGLVSIIAVDGAVRGVRTLRDGRLEEHPGRVAILATGGFQGNHELLTRYVVRDAACLALRASNWSTGDGLIAATEMGAAVSPALGTFYGHALAAPPARYDKSQLREASGYHGGMAVALNLRGERFADETADTGEEALNQHLAQQPRGRGAYVVDEDAMDEEAIQGRRTVTRSILGRIRALGGKVFEAETLEALCAALAEVGIPPARALATLLDYNAAIRSGRADDLAPSRRRRRKALDRPPFRAVIVQAGITFTMGGLLIDERARVLWRSGSTSSFASVPVERAYADTAGPSIGIGADYRQTPIAGLYAAGNDAGNISHFGYIGGLATALATGRTAGSEAAVFASSSN